MPRTPLALLALLLVLLVPASARADGDPASDVLITDTVFFPYDLASEDVTSKLRGTIDAARTAGLPVRVAVIQSPRDLGSVTNLFGKPREYAYLLASEISNPAAHADGQGANDALIIVMPAGFGTSKVPPNVDAALRKTELPADATSDELVAAAGWGVQEYARLSNKPIKAAFEKPEAPDGGGGSLVVVLVVVGILALAGVLIVIRVRAASASSQSPGGNT